MDIALIGKNKEERESTGMTEQVNYVWVDRVLVGGNENEGAELLGGR